MPRRRRLILALLFLSTGAFPQTLTDQSLWNEYGLISQTQATVGQAQAIAYRFKDATGALAAWEWQRDSSYKPCSLEAFCSAKGPQSVLASANYLIKLTGAVAKPEWDHFIQTLPDRHDSSLPAILTYIPRANLIPNSARYILGPASLKAFAPQLDLPNLGFQQGAEAQVAEYKDASGIPTHLAVFYYPTPEMARLHLADFSRLPAVKVKRSDVLLAVVYADAPIQAADRLLSRIEYEAKITWNEVPPPSPIKPLYLLIRDILYLSLVLIALCSMGGLIYAGIRLYRRRFGTLEADEAMTTLRLSGD